LYHVSKSPTSGIIIFKNFGTRVKKRFATPACLRITKQPSHFILESVDDELFKIAVTGGRAAMGML
jgi:hypothetical protein